LVEKIGDLFNNERASRNYQENEVASCA
jgi:hypothetical protein